MIQLKDCPTFILQNEWEFNKLMEIYQSHQPKVVLEIGSFYGGTLWHWIHYNSQLEKLTSIDLPITPKDTRYHNMINAKAKWKDWIHGTNIRFTEILGDSRSRQVLKKAFEVHQEPDVDFLLIDGDHSYKGVLNDFHNYYGLVKKGSLIVLHDVITIKSVKKFWDQIKSRHNYTEIWAQKNGWGFGIIQKTI
jgi:cephalosporin hydroxylase